ncbi:Ger(x)C family spore germination protein [Selenihalanaerobacter shriftii]|uniref:Spore germination protein KC n=1 Tax=Selenihalanaerobacter shriftii TaxID=142842 RepID=A0A1T4QC73_9FIRM|nr:Ger(x)C family spore germination protein [Selenihalanaerobacter shriftii]SKA01274.1 spore germination protein KC [Selenihalanaerobacter shriftii]
MNQKFLLITIIIILLTTISGCYDRTEIDQLGLVAATGIDQAKDKDKLKLTAQIIKPSQIKAQGAKGASGTKAYWTVSATGYTVFDAIRNLTEQTGRKLFWAHNIAIIFGEEFAREGINKSLDLFNRDPELRRRSWILVAKGVEAKEILETETELEKIPAVGIDLLMKSKSISGKVFSADVQQFIPRLTSQDVSPVATPIELVAKENLRKEEKEAKETGAKKPKKRMRVNGAAVFKDDKLVAWFGERATRGLLWIRGDVQSGSIIVNCPDDKEKKISLEIIGASRELIPKIVNGEPQIDIEISEEGNLADKQCPENLVTLEKIEMLEDRQAAAIRNEIELAIKRSQELNNDILGFSKAFYRELPQEWKKMQDDWDEIFPSLKVNIKVTAQIRRYGLIKNAEQSQY